MKKNKTVIIVSHDYEVIKHADVQYKIMNKQLNLCKKAQDNCIQSEIVKSVDQTHPSTPKHQQGIIWPFIRFLNRNRKKEKRIPKAILFFVCIAVSITSLGLILSNEFRTIQSNSVADLSDKTLFVVNDTLGSGGKSEDLEDYMSFSEDDIQKIKSIQTIQAIYPFYEFLGHGRTKNDASVDVNTLKFQLRIRRTI